MRKHRRSRSESHDRSRQRRHEMKALRRGIGDLGEAWASLGISMGTNALRGVVNGMRVTADAITGKPDADSPEDKPKHSKPLRGLSNVASTWAEVGLAMGRVALEKSAEGLEMTANALENNVARHPESTSVTTSDKPSDPESTSETTSDKPSDPQES